MLRWRPNPTRSSPKELRKLLRQMIRFDELWRSLKIGGFIWKWTIHEYPKSILHWQFCWHFQTRVCSRLQTLSRIQSFQTISASGPREILHADFLSAFLHHDFVPRRMPLSSKSVHSENVSYFQWKIWQRRIWKILRLKLTDINSGLMSTLD